MKLLRESHQSKEQVLRNQIKRLRNELGIGGVLDVGEKICVRLTRENRTFGFKLLGRVEVSHYIFVFFSTSFIFNNKTSVV